MKKWWRHAETFPAYVLLVLKVVSFNQNYKDLLGCYIKQIMNVFHSCNGAKCSFVECWNVPFNSAPPR